MSFNIRTASASDGANGWEHRKRLALARIRAFDPDLLGMQECRADTQADYVRAALPDYDFYGVPRGGDAETGAEMAPILVRRAAFEPIESGHFWLSERPHVAGSKGWGAQFARTVSWVRLCHRSSGRTVTFVNTHFDYLPTAIEGAARFFGQWLDELEEGSPVIVSGDFNADKGSEPYRLLADGRRRFDVFRMAHALPRDEGSFHDFGRLKAARPIDWILLSDHFRVVVAEVDRSRSGPLFPSDHYPLVARLAWREQAASALLPSDDTSPPARHPEPSTMQPTLHARYRFSRDELILSMSHHYRTPFRRAFLVAGHLLSLLFVALALWLLITSGRDSGSLGTLGLIMLFPLYWWFLHERLNRWVFLRGFDERPDANAIVTWELGADGFRNGVEGLATSESRWALIAKAVETRDGFLLYLQRNIFLWLPFGAFEQPEAVERVRDFIVASGVPYVRRGA